MQLYPVITLFSKIFVQWEIISQMYVKTQGGVKIMKKL